MHFMDELANATPPPYLYHYTDGAGLLGILRNDALWASQIQYLNDGSEHRLGMLQTAAILRAPTFQVRADETQLVSALLRRIEMGTPARIFVASLSANGDSLSQWRGYCRGQAGYAIGFPGEQLRDRQKSVGLLAPVQYRKADQLRLIGEQLEHAFQLYRGEYDAGAVPAGEDRLLYTVRNAVMWLTEYAPLVKHESFSEEAEWRLFASWHPDLETHYRAGSNSLIPYIEVPLAGRLPNPNRQLDIRLGPNVYEEQQRLALSQFLLDSGIKASVRGSGIPYRDW